MPDDTTTQETSPTTTEGEQTAATTTDTATTAVETTASAVTPPPAEATATEDSTAGTAAATVPDNFDPDRAMATIRAQRASEDRLKEELREAKAKAGKWDEHERSQLSAQERAEQDAQTAAEKADKATTKLRRANLLTELAKPGLGIVNAKAAAKLLEGVEYSDDDEPTNLGDPDDPASLISRFLSDNDFLRGKAAKPIPPNTDARAGGNDTAPELSAEELAAAKRDGMTPEEYVLFRDNVSLDQVQQASST